MSIDHEYARIQVRYRVASGFWPAEEIAETVLEECFDPADVTSADEGWLNQLIEEAFAAQRKAEASWPADTDFDRLAAAFVALEEGGIIALHNAGMTQSDGLDDITEVYHDRGAEVSGIQGYCFYHMQDVERAIDGHGLLLTFGEIRGDLAKGTEIGRRIVAELTKAGFRTTWAGTTEQRINIDDVRWQKRYRSD
jgi:Domain of unknown function (DUF6891)